MKGAAFSFEDQAWRSQTVSLLQVMFPLFMSCVEVFPLRLWEAVPC